MPTEAPITFSSAVDPAIRDAVVTAPHFVRWLRDTSTRFDLRAVTVENAFLFGSRVGFILVRADALHEGRQVPGLALLRGDSVSMLIVLRCAGHPDHTILTCEPRLPAGIPDFLALPAGMIDGEATALDTAVRELAEEVGTDLPVTPTDLVEMTRVHLSPGGCDEAISLYYARIDVTEPFIRRLDGRRTGQAAEHETIRLRVVPLDALDALGVTDARTLLSWRLYRDRFPARTDVPM